MSISNRSDLISGVCIAAFGIYVVYDASRLPYTSEFGPGPGFFPLWLGIGLLVFAICLILGIFSRSQDGTHSGSQSWVGAGRALGGWFGLVVVIVLLPWLGFGLSLALLTAFLILVLERRSPLTALSVAIGLAVAFHLIFVSALGLSLPSGPWGF